MDITTLCQFLKEQILVNLLSQMLDNPEESQVEFIFSERTVSFSIATNDRDRGKLIGLRGRNVDAIRTLCGAICARHGFKFHLTVVGD